MAKRKCMADGGQVAPVKPKERPWQERLAEMWATKPKQSIAQQAPAPVPKDAGNSGLAGTVEKVKTRQQLLDEISNYAAGGLLPTDDQSLAGDFPSAPAMPGPSVAIAPAANTQSISATDAGWAANQPTDMAGQTERFLGGVRSAPSVIGAGGAASATGGASPNPNPTPPPPSPPPPPPPPPPSNRRGNGMAGMVDSINQQIGMGKAMNSLSMVDRMALTNPGNQPYSDRPQSRDGRMNGQTFVSPGSAAETSQNDAKNSALTSLRDKLTQQPAFKDGGMVRFAGKGGPRDDKIPVKVAGQSINVSDGENAVILPAKTASNQAAVQAIGQIIQQSNDGRAPKMGVEPGGSYANGAYPYTDDPIPALQQVYAPVDGKGMAVQAFPSTMSAVQQHGDAAQQAAASGNYGGALGHVARGGVAGTIGVADDVMRSAAYALDPAANALKTFVTGDSEPINKPRQGPGKTQQATYSNEGRPSAVQSAGLAAQAIANAPDPRIAATTGNAGDAEFFPNNGRLSFVDKGLDVQRQQLADGTGMMHRPRDGKTILFANMGPNQYVGADGTPNQPWEKTAQYAQAVAQNQKDKEDLLSMRAERAYQDSISENRYQRDMGARQMQAIGATQGIAGQALEQAGKRQEVDANAPDQNRQLVAQKIEDAQMTAQGRQELRDLYSEHAAASPEDAPAIAEKIRVRTGKDKGQHYKAAILNGAKSLEGNEADRGYLINEMTGEMRPMAALAPAAVTPSKMAIDYLKANPKAAADFDAKYGQGAAKQILGK